MIFTRYQGAAYITRMYELYNFLINEATALVDLSCSNKVDKIYSIEKSEV